MKRNTQRRTSPPAGAVQPTAAVHVNHPAPSAEPPQSTALQPAEPSRLLKMALQHEVLLDIPKDAKLQDIEATLVVAIDGYRRLGEAAERLEPIIGRILLTISERQLFRPVHKNFTNYLMDVVVKRMGFGRSHAFDALRIARHFPSLTEQDYQRIGASRLRLATQITGEQDPGYRQILDQSLKITVQKFGEAVRDIRQQTRQQQQPTVTAILSIRVTAEQRRLWETALDRSHLQAGELLEAACQAWLSLMEEARPVSVLERLAAAN